VGNISVVLSLVVFRLLTFSVVYHITYRSEWLYTAFHITSPPYGSHLIKVSLLSISGHKNKIYTRARYCMEKISPSIMDINVFHPESLMSYQTKVYHTS